MEQKKRIEVFRQRQDYEYKKFIPVENAKKVNRHQAHKAWIAGGLVGAVLLLFFQLIELFLLVQR